MIKYLKLLNNDSQEDRIHYIDISRAFAIFCIVLVHSLGYCEHCDIILKLIASFDVPLFFIISGFVYRYKSNISFFNYIKKKFQRIMIPYFVWAFLFLIPYVIFADFISPILHKNYNINVIKSIIDIFYGVGYKTALKQNTPLWILPALFTMSILCYVIIKYINKHSKSKTIVLPVIILVGYISTYIPVILPWGLTTALNLGMFFIFGYYLRNYLTSLLNSNKIFYLILLIIGLISMYFNPQKISYKEYNYGIFLLAILSGLSFSLLIINISKLINTNIVLEYIGKNTMGILIFHKIFVLIFQICLMPYFENFNIVIELLISVIIASIAIILSLVFTEIIRKICPTLIGEN